MSQMLQTSLGIGQERAGLVYHPEFFSKDAQLALLDTIAGIVRLAPVFQPVMPRTGKPFSVQMTNCGPLGWVSDKAGYRYQALHPITGKAWPPLPEPLLDLWRSVGAYGAVPEACLINFYGAGAKMGSHQDRDEADTVAPVVSVSLGDDATFHVGGLARSDAKTRFKLRSGDVVVLGGASRLAFHGVDRIHLGTSLLELSPIMKGCCRINLTLRRVSSS
jgi:DNA oxidative demethylase